MKLLTIYTHRYHKLLENFAASWATGVKPSICKVRGQKSGPFSVCIHSTTEPSFVEELMALLIDIALQENPIYRYAPKLRDMAADLERTQLYKNLQRDLNRFLKHSRTLHLEGYIAFRMTEYREKLDMMSYSLIKKMKLTQQD